jgi:hypothetical protein
MPIRQIGVTEVTYYRWRQEFGGLKIEQVRRNCARRAGLRSFPGQPLHGILGARGEHAQRAGGANYAASSRSSE